MAKLLFPFVHLIPEYVPLPKIKAAIQVNMWFEGRF